MLCPRALKERSGSTDGNSTNGLTLVEVVRNGNASPHLKCKIPLSRAKSFLACNRFLNFTKFAKCSNMYRSIAYYGAGCEEERGPAVAVVGVPSLSSATNQNPLSSRCPALQHTIVLTFNSDIRGLPVLSGYLTYLCKFVIICRNKRISMLVGI